MCRKQMVVFTCIGILVAAGVALAEPPLAEVSYLGSSVEFAPRAWGQGFLLTVSTPDGSIVQKTVRDGVPSFDLSELEGAVIDGRYKYELVPIVALPRQRDVAPDKAGPEPRIEISSLSGSFLVAGGSIVPPGGAEPDVAAGGPDAPADVVVNDDLIVIGNACVGTDCVDGESFTDDGELKLKANNTAITFDDTSTSSGYPNRDWRIRANDATSGGASYLAVFDVTGGTKPFSVEAGAANNVLVVDSNERVGINTSTPAAELHIRAATSPAIVMEQTSGTPYQWRIYANDMNWFLEDYTGNTYPIIVEKDTSGTQFPFIIKADGKVGWGTAFPAYQFEVYRSGVNSAVVVTREGGAQNYINATAGFGNFGTVTDHPLRLAVNGAWQMRINNDSSIVMANGATLTAGGVWTDYSRRAAKKDIKSLSMEEASTALNGLEPVKFAYKVNGERHVGFIAEDVPDLVASADRNGLSPMDVVAVLTRVVQQQQRMLRDKDAIDEQQQATIEQLMSRISALESR